MSMGSGVVVKDNLQKGDSVLDRKAKEFLRTYPHDNDPSVIFTKIREEFNRNGKLDSSPESNICKALTVFEFDNGLLVSSAIPERYRTFCIDLSRSLQKEYRCEEVSEKATAELVALNFVRTLEIQYKINSYLDMGTATELGIKFLEILSKELDRANRHYLNALQTLRILKQPPLAVNIKAQTAIVGQNQIVQSNAK